MFLDKSICTLKVTDKSKKEINKVKSELRKERFFIKRDLEIRFTTAHTFSQCLVNPRFILLQINLRRSGDVLANHLKIRRNLQLSGTTKAMPWGRQICTQCKPHLRRFVIKVLLTNVRSKKTSSYYGEFQLPSTRLHLDFNQKSSNNSSCITMLYSRTSNNSHLSTTVKATKTHPNYQNNHNQSVILHLYLPITVISPRPLSSVLNVAVVKRFDGIPLT